MSQVVTNPTPQQRFTESTKAVKSHRDLISMPEFQIAIDFACLEFEHRLAQTPQDNFNLCAAAQLKRAGAQEFLRILRNLAETPEVVKAEPIPNLNHRA